MPAVPTTPRNQHIIPHQDKVEKVIDQRISGDQGNDNARFALRGTTVIAAPTAPSATYVQAEAASAKAAIDAIRVALKAAGILA